MGLLGGGWGAPPYREDDREDESDHECNHECGGQRGGQAAGGAGRYLHMKFMRTKFTYKKFTHTEFTHDTSETPLGRGGVGPCRKYLRQRGGSGDSLHLDEYRCRARNHFVHGQGPFAGHGLAQQRRIAREAALVENVDLRERRVGQFFVLYQQRGRGLE